jgi:hypothetical protein
MYQSARWLVARCKDMKIKYFDCNDVICNDTYGCKIKLRKNNFVERLDTTKES